jgi:hypothetical protein
MFCHMAPARERTPTHLVTDKQTPGAMRTTITTSDCKGFAVVMDAMGKKADRYFQNIQGRSSLANRFQDWPVLPSHYFEAIITPRAPVRSRIQRIFGVVRDQQQRRPKMGENGNERLLGLLQSSGTCGRYCTKGTFSLFPQLPFLRTRGESGVMQQGTPVGLLCFIFLAARTRGYYQEHSGNLSGTFQEPFITSRRSIYAKLWLRHRKLASFMSRYKARHP